MTTYKIDYTNSNEPPIQVGEKSIDTSTAIKLFGRRRLGYGQDMNENLLRLLESFSCPEVPASSPPVPDVGSASGSMFDTPVKGQLWFNSTPTKEVLCVYDGSVWVAHQKFGDLAANWGIIADGGQIPLPVSPSGRTFSRAECSWIVSPYGYPNTIDYMECKTDATATVTMKYSLENSVDIVGGYANYLIIAIPGNVNRD